MCLSPRSTRRKNLAVADDGVGSGGRAGPRGPAPTSSPAHLARAAVEGMLCALADGLEALVVQGSRVRRVILIGGGARSEAVRRIAPAVFGVPVLVPPPGEYVADGAARQAAWVALGGDEPPEWTVSGTELFEAEPTPHVRAAYADARNYVPDYATI